MELVRTVTPSNTKITGAGAIEGVDSAFEIRYKQKSGGGYADWISENVPDGENWTVHVQITIEVN